MINALNENEIFVFGSNLAGRHGKGAALTAAKKFQARYGVGEGRTGQCYAIPTKDASLRTLSLERIEQSVKAFIAYAETNQHLKFLLTPIGCGLAGYRAEQIAPMFKDAPVNVVKPEEFIND